MAGPNRYAPQSGLGGELYGPRTDGRQIDAQVLARLWTFYQDSGPLMAALRSPLTELSTAPQHGVGTFGRLHCEHILARDDNRLANVERSERPDHFKSRFDIIKVATLGRGSGHDAQRAQETGGYVVSAADMKAFAFEELNYIGENGIVASRP
jgi:hypothetical protein